MKAIEARGLAPLALPVLDALDAFGPLAAQVLLAAEPLLGPQPPSASGRLADLLLSPDLRSEIKRRLGSGPHDHE